MRLSPDAYVTPVPLKKTFEQRLPLSPELLQEARTTSQTIPLCGRGRWRIVLAREQFTTIAELLVVWAISLNVVHAGSERHAVVCLY